jgi:hypothetical protein
LTCAVNLGSSVGKTFMLKIKSKKEIRIRMAYHHWGTSTLRENEHHVRPSASESV